MNKSQRIYIGTGSTASDNFITAQLEQEVNTLEFLSMSIDTKDIYRDFNSDYGVLIGRVIANGGVGIPNAKISIFIPLNSDDASDSVISSLYPYNSPTDKNNDGKRYNLLPRVAQTELSTGEIKPKQPFGSFPIKPELISNESFLNVYKKYYKYTALTNSAGDYMIFGVPTGTQTVHLSVDITDIGKYSMTPASMITAGYPANLFVGGKSIKPSTDLSDLPNIETQEIAVDIIPFWGDTTNFTIGITRQDFRIRAVLEGTFTIFGTSMTMGTNAVFGDPDLSEDDKAYYTMSTEQENNFDIRVNRRTPIDFKIFTYGTNVDMAKVDHFLAAGGAIPVNADVDIRELDPSEYFVFNENGNFLLTVPCNRNKIITDEFGTEIPVSDNNLFGVFTKFYGMALVRYDDNDSLIPITKTFSDKFKDNHPGHTARCSWFKIPQSTPFEYEADVNSPTVNTTKWRLKYTTFVGGQVYSVAQLFPVRNTKSINNLGAIASSSAFNNTINYLIDAELLANRYNMGGALIKVGGKDGVTESKYDQENYIGTPPTETITTYRYDFSPNASFINGDGVTNYYFGGQWLNFCLLFPQFTFTVTASEETDRSFGVADVFTQYYPAPIANTFRADNQQKLFGGVRNSKNVFRGDAFSTDFVNISKNDLTKLSKIPLKGLNIRKWNNNNEIISNPDSLIISAKGLKYLKPQPAPIPPTSYTYSGWDTYFATYGSIPAGEPATAYIFKGIYNNDCVQMLADFNVI
jgi:hypothetical protein